MWPCKVFGPNRTKVFHVKRFCPIGGQNRTKLMFKISWANENLALVALEPDPRVAANPLAPLKGTDRDEPYRNDALRELAADGAFIIVENGLFFLEPGAQFGEVRAHHLMRLPLVPPGQGTLEHLALRQSGAPHIGEIAAIIEFHRDREIIMRRQGVLAQFRGQFIRLPGPGELRRSIERHIDRILQNANVLRGLAADPRGLRSGGLRAKDLVFAEPPQMPPASSRAAEPLASLVRNLVSPSRAGPGQINTATISPPLAPSCG